MLRAGGRQGKNGAETTAWYINTIQNRLPFVISRPWLEKTRIEGLRGQTVPGSAPKPYGSTRSGKRKTLHRI